MIKEHNLTQHSPENLAINGGEKVCTEPWPPRRLFGEEEKQAAIALFDESIESGNAFGYGGAQEEAFGQEFAAALGGGFADGVNSGTNAVYVALRSLDLEPFTEVIVPPITDPGGVMPVALMNCIPVPADSAPNSYNAGTEQIAARLTDRTSAILVAHIAGIPADMEPILELAKTRNIPVVEDCAQAHGTKIGDKFAGTLGEVAAFSTMFGKHIATGGQGGVVFTTSEERYWNVRRMADRGKPLGLEGQSDNVRASLNCNMDELHAAIGREQVKKLPGIVERRRKLALAIESGCRERLSAVQMVGDPAWGKASFWFLFFRIDEEKLSVDKSAFVQALAAEGLPVGNSYSHSPPDKLWFQQQSVYGESRMPWSNPLYKGDSAPHYEMPNIQAAIANHFTLAIHENLTEREVECTLRALKKVESAYSA
jgi:dTDP-4-amino-4,6-dideoxygalactose transaminase